MAKDCLGKELSLGDQVKADIFSAAAELETCAVVDISPSGIHVTVEYFNYVDRPQRKDVLAAKVTKI